MALVLALPLIAPSQVPVLVLASSVSYEDETDEEEECKEESDYLSLCSGAYGVNGKPFCDHYNAIERAENISRYQRLLG